MSKRIIGGVIQIEIGHVFGTEMVYPKAESFTKKSSFQHIVKGTSDSCVTLVISHNKPLQ